MLLLVEAWVVCERVVSLAKFVGVPARVAEDLRGACAQLGGMENAAHVAVHVRVVATFHLLLEIDAKFFLNILAEGALVRHEVALTNVFQKRCVAGSFFWINGHVRQDLAGLALSPARSGECVFSYAYNS